MKKSPQNSDLSSLITRQLVAACIQEALRRHIGAGQRFSVREAADAVNIQESTLYGYLGGDGVPTMDTFLNLCRLLGPEFINDVLRLTGHDGVRASAAPAGNDHELNADIAAAQAQLGNGLRDGRIDHSERPRIVRGMIGLRDRVNAWLARHAEGNGIDWSKLKGAGHGDS